MQYFSRVGSRNLLCNLNMVILGVNECCITAYAPENEHGRIMKNGDVPLLLSL